MADKPFVINDRRRFSSEGELRPDAPVREEPKAAPVEEVPEEASKGPQLVTESTPAEPTAESVDLNEPPPLTEEQMASAARAYNATVERLDTAVRAMNPGADHMPSMTFERLVQSLYMQALIQLGGSPDPNQQAQVDILGARSTIDMLTIIGDKTINNLSTAEERLVESALFELRMGFLEVTQALARQAAQQRQAEGIPGMPGMPPMGGGPSIVR